MADILKSFAEVVHELHGLPNSVAFGVLIVVVVIVMIVCTTCVILSR
ncbi:hypothetical protein [Liquorilactobacillus hordei]|nr:hypothetical protein [Liquorilactobacillus hordei]QYH51110.1 hypothetical protein G6O70_00695 [Liquorilactobacillus hordei DSM 19519]